MSICTRNERNVNNDSDIPQAIMHSRVRFPSRVLFFSSVYASGARARVYRVIIRRGNDDARALAISLGKLCAAARGRDVTWVMRFY